MTNPLESYRVSNSFFTFSGQVVLLIVILFMICGSLKAEFRAQLDIDSGLRDQNNNINSTEYNLYNQGVSSGNLYNSYNAIKVKKIHNNKTYNYSTHASLRNNTQGIFYNSEKDKTDNNQTRDKPPLDPLRISGELVAGVGSGFLIGGGMGILSLGIAMGAGAPAEFGTIAYGFLGFVVGYPIGTTIGVYLIGNMGDETGEFWYSLFGSIIGGLGGFYFIGKETNYLPFMILTPIGATIGFNLSRRYERSNNSKALLNYKEGGLSLNFPNTYYRYSLSNKSVITADIIEIDF